MEEVRVVLEQARVLLGDAARVRSVDLADEDLCSTAVLVESVGRLVDAMRLGVAAEVEARSAYGFGPDGLAQRHGFVKGIHFVEYLTRVSQGEAARRIKVGNAIRPSIYLNGEPALAVFPLLAAALTEGEVGVDAAAQIIEPVKLCV